MSLYGDNRTLYLPKLKDSILYLKGKGNYIPELIVAGTKSWVGLETGIEHNGYPYLNEIKNITLLDKSSLDIVCNEHEYVSMGGRAGRAQGILRAVRLFCVIRQWLTHVTMRLSKAREHTTARVSPKITLGSE